MATLQGISEHGKSNISAVNPQRLDPQGGQSRRLRSRRNYYRQLVRRIENGFNRQTAQIRR
jgi:hypothetical protein